MRTAHRPAVAARRLPFDDLAGERHSLRIDGDINGHLVILGAPHDPVTLGDKHERPRVVSAGHVESLVAGHAVE